MLKKLVKYDLMFSKTSFFSAAICLIAISVAARMVFFAVDDVDRARIIISFMNVGGFGLLIVVAFMQTLSLYKDSLFGDTGYLMLTLPACRGRLLLSKLIVTGIWYNFSMLIVLIAGLIQEGTQREDWLTGEIRPMVTFSRGVTVYVEGFFVVFTLVCLVFMLVTLSRSFFGRFRVPGFVTAVFGVIFFYVHNIALAVLRGRYTQRVTERVERLNPYGNTHSTLTRQEPLIGLEYGRIAVGDMFIDFYAILINIAIGLAALGITYYLFKRRVSFQ